MAAYFHQFDDRMPPQRDPLPPWRTLLWHFFAGMVVLLGLRYVVWRWTVSLNWDAPAFSIAIALAETCAFFATLLFYFDIWREGDTAKAPTPSTRAEAGLDGDGAIGVDIYVTTYDEPVSVVEPTIRDALAVSVPDQHRLDVHILDDGTRPEMAKLARDHEVGYITRRDNRGYKAGNLRNALLKTTGDFIVICDADTRLFPTFLTATMGYFRNSDVAWVQTPHWFYDIPEGRPWAEYLPGRFGRQFRWLAGPMQWLSLRRAYGADPFLIDPAFFFDVIQRRRNRHGASFCCGAASIHRREAIFDVALDQQREDIAALEARLARSRRGTIETAAPNPIALLRAVEAQPFRYHVSEDIYTSILAHRRGWRSVYHPDIEARMLSPQTPEAWAAQKLKYAGGTFDIMLRANPLWQRAMPLTTRLHYAATFLSYGSVLWMPIFLLAPVLSLFTGIAPVDAYSVDFFIHLLPLLFANEVAIMIAAKGYDTHAGRIQNIAALPITLRALWQVLRGKRPHFAPTPKVPRGRAGLGYLAPNLWLLALMAAAGVFGICAHMTGAPGRTEAFLFVNLFWLAFSAGAIGRVALSAILMVPVAEEDSGDTPPIAESERAPLHVA